MLSDPNDADDEDHFVMLGESNDADASSKGSKASFAVATSKTTQVTIP